MNKAMKLLVIALSLHVVVLLGGCAANAEIDRLRTEVKAANERAANAQAAADAATAEAREARAAAERAGKAAVDARAATEAVEKRFDEMFRKSLNQ